MLFSNSPVKKVVEKLNPFSQKNKISRLKFERKSDYRTFLKFIKDNTKEIEDIKIPDPEDKKRKGLMIGGGLLGLALLASFGRGKGDSDDDNTGKLKSISGVIEKAKADSRKAASGGKDRRKLDQGDDVLDKTRTERSGKIEEQKTRRKIVKKLNKKIGQEKKIKDYLKFREQRKITKQYAREYARVTQNTDPLVTKDTKITAGNMFDPPDKNMKGKKITISGGLSIDEDAKIGFPSEKDIKDEQKLTRKIIKKDERKRLRDFFNRPKNQEQAQQDLIDKLNRAAKEADNIAERAKTSRNRIQDKQINERKLNQLRQQEIFNRQYSMDGGYGDSNIGDLTQNKSSQRKIKVDRSKFFKAPEVPKKITPKQLNNFDKFNRFSNRILNSPAAKFTSFMGGLLANPKFMILKSLMEPTPLADGTLEGKPGVSVFSQQLMFDEDMAVNIFMPPEGRESMIPFDADIEKPIVTTPTDLQAPSTNIFIDYEFNTSEDLFFIKMAGS